MATELNRMTGYKEPKCCPKCESGYINAGHFNTDSCEAWRRVECESCGFEWDEIFVFSYWEEHKTVSYTGVEYLGGKSGL